MKLKISIIFIFLIIGATSYFLYNAHNLIKQNKNKPESLHEKLISEAYEHEKVAPHIINSHIYEFFFAQLLLKIWESKAIEKFENLYEIGINIAALNIADHYYNNNEKEKAKEWYLKLANKDIKIGQYLLCSLEVDKWCNEIKPWLIPTMIKINNSEKFSAASIYFMGIFNFEVNPSESIKLFKELAESGYLPAQCFVGFVYENGYRDFDPDDNKSWKWLNIAAENGCDFAQYKIGMGYASSIEKAKGNTKIEFQEKAIHWLEPLAENGWSYAQYYLGKSIADKYPDKSKYWIKRSAKQGNEKALLEINQKNILNIKIENKKIKEKEEALHSSLWGLLVFFIDNNY